MEAAPLAADPLLTIMNLHVHFAGNGRGLRRGAVRAVDGVDLHIPRGTTLGLVGESGSGKSTLGRAILRLVPVASGQVRFDGMDVLAADRRQLFRLRRRVQVVFQDTSGSLNPRMTAAQVIAEPLTIHKASSKRDLPGRTADLLSRVGLDPRAGSRYPHEFSGGQRQRIGIARALALAPDFVVLDEPVSALDVSVQAQILNMLGDLKSELGLTYLFIAHNLAVVERFSDRVAVMYRGRIVETASSAELYERPLHPYTLKLLSAVPGAPQPLPDRRPAPAPALALNRPPADGCRFLPHCPYASEVCRDCSPPLEAVPGRPADHLVACHHAEQVGASTRDPV